MPGSERSGRKGSGAAMLADRGFAIARRGADLMRARASGGLAPEEMAWLEEVHAFVMATEIYAAKIALVRALTDDEDVTDACLRLAQQSVDRYGPLLRLADVA